MWGLMALLCASNLLTVFAVNLPMLLVARSCWARAWAASGRWRRPCHAARSGRPLPRAMSLVFTGVSVATVSAAPIGAYVSDTLGWRAAFVIAGRGRRLALLAQG
jgi:predicted MFS family arabinose efflux permease